MKKHTHLIRLIVITAALISLGIMAFKYLHAQQAHSTKITAHAALEKEIQPALHSLNTSAASENVIIQYTNTKAVPVVGPVTPRLTKIKEIIKQGH